MAYACVTHSFNYNHRINTSPYHFNTGSHVDVKELHPFWSRCYIHTPSQDRTSKVGCARAYNAHFVGYDFTSTLTRTYFVIEINSNGTYGKVRSSKDVILAQSINFPLTIPDPTPPVPSTYSSHIVPAVEHTGTPVPAPVVHDTHSGVQRVDTPPTIIPTIQEWTAPSNSLVNFTEPDLPNIELGVPTVNG